MRATQTSAYGPTQQPFDPLRSEPRGRPNASDAEQLLGVIGRGWGQSCERQRVLLIMLRRTSPQVRRLNDPPPNIEGCALTPSHNLLRGLSIAQWVNCRERRWVNADERQGAGRAERSQESRIFRRRLIRTMNGPLSGSRPLGCHRKDAPMIGLMVVGVEVDIQARLLQSELPLFSVSPSGGGVPRGFCGRSRVRSIS
ncbi:MAG: hypothetical protein JWO04_3076 [Gammaproteobacteria bacterium]|nr:hypothetical protein [Gammaproteobacteria bacterium]